LKSLRSERPIEPQIEDTENKTDEHNLHYAASSFFLFRVESSFYITSEHLRYPLRTWQIVTLGGVVHSLANHPPHTHAFDCACERGKLGDDGSSYIFNPRLMQLRFLRLLMHHSEHDLICFHLGY
jgi:hypothetical protein